MDYANFKVDEWAYIVGTNKQVKIHIVEVIRNECSAHSIQTYYVGRTYIKSALNNNWKLCTTTPSVVMGKQFEKFAELELEKIE